MIACVLDNQGDEQQQPQNEAGQGNAVQPLAGVIHRTCPAAVLPAGKVVGSWIYLNLSGVVEAAGLIPALVALTGVQNCSWS